MNRTLGLGRTFLGMIAVGSIAISGCPSDTNPDVDTGLGTDTGTTVDGGHSTLDSGHAADTGSTIDTGTTTDTGATTDTNTPATDAFIMLDGGACAAATECDNHDPCDGDETCDATHHCADGTNATDGTTCDADGMTTTMDICVAGVCGATRCGDHFVSTGEECDDGNDVDGDGCNACAFSCHAGTDCDDANACNGVETCGTGHFCVPGTPATNGTTCGVTNVCMGGVCVPPSCTSPDACADTLRCNGAETCTAGACAAGTAPSCDDASACTADSCQEAGAMCRHALVDADHDGQAPTSLGTCGTDCNDADPTVHAGAIDVCGDGIDNDCDGHIDEGGLTTYYADCDNDSYAATGATGIDSCVQPNTSLTGCTGPGHWTTRAPVVGDTSTSDCNDRNATVNGGQMTYQTTAIPGAPAASDFDYNCDGIEMRQYPAAGSCSRSSPTSRCLYTPGWQLNGDAGVPMCGATGAYITGCTMALCQPVTIIGMQRRQACR